MKSKIKRAIENTIKNVFDDFKSNPTMFYTESDVVSYFYYRLLKELPMITERDIEEKQHLLVHLEYPTPFRCDMKGTDFYVKGDEEKTDNKGKFKRGHYDLVILNPEFIKRHSFELLKAQNYKLYKETVINNLIDPPILYGLEFMYSRDPLKYSRGQDREKGITEFSEKIKQDYKKLLAGKEFDKFMIDIKMLTFIKGCSGDVKSSIKGKIKDIPDICLCFGRR